MYEVSLQMDFRAARWSARLLCVYLPIYGQNVLLVSDPAHQCSEVRIVNEGCDESEPAPSEMPSIKDVEDDSVCASLQALLFTFIEHFIAQRFSVAVPTSCTLISLMAKATNRA